MKKNIVSLGIMTSLLALSGCGGSSNNTPTPPPHTGNVGDGYIQGAYVCHDADNDMDCLDETYATTAADGSFTLSNYDPAQDLLVQIPIGAVDNGPFSDGSTTPRPFAAQTWYYYPAGAAPQNGPIFVGPLSTLVFAQIELTPGISVTDAIGIVATTMGVDSDQVLSNYLEDSTTEGNETQFVAEIAGSSITSTTTSTPGSYGSEIQAVLDDLPNVVSTATTADSALYDTGTYVNSSNPQTTSLTYAPVNDICNDMLACTYFAFEEWDSSVQYNSNFPLAPDQEHKKLCMTVDENTDNILNITEELYQGSAWSTDTYGTSTEVNYLNDTRETIIDMSNVNSIAATYISPYRLFPATNIACNGSNATFKSGLLEYKIYVSQTDLNNQNGATLPQGSTVGPIVDNITFQTGDKLYKAIGITQNKTYIVDNAYNFVTNTTTATPKEYIVHEEGTTGGVAFVSMANTNSINAMVQLTDTDFIIEYQDSSNFTKLEVTSPASSANNGTVDVIQVVSGVEQSTNTMTYEVETHNNTAFFIVKNYYGIGGDLFLGHINSISTVSFVYGKVIPEYSTFDVTQGGTQDGDIMDDIMLNTSARDRVLNAFNIAVP